MSGSFGDVVARGQAEGTLVVQPRMGFADPARMRAGLLATRDARACTVGTITLDSYTRIGDHAAVRAALRRGDELNGYPIAGHDADVTRSMLRGVAGPGFPVQVRHGSADPRAIVIALLAAGLDATEGGPVSYCLPYSRTPLADAIEHWRESCELLAAARAPGHEPHLETFGGCMMGQLCPPALLVALSVLEGLFFVQHGLRSISLSYAQQTNADQDTEAVTALRRLAGELLPGVESHIVIYGYMGVYPRTAGGARRLLEEAARLAVTTGAARLIVKTSAEAFRIPTIEENVLALETAARAASATRTAGTRPGGGPATDTGIYAQARALVGAVLELADDLGRALRTAFARGYLDVPYCLHPDNAGRTRGCLDRAGRLHWQRIGSLPIGDAVEPRGLARMTAAELMDSLSFVRNKFDCAASFLSAALYERKAPPMTQVYSLDPVRELPPTTREHLTSPVTRAVLRIQNQITTAAREFLGAAGFVELFPPIIGPVTDPGARGAKQVDMDYYGHKYKLMTSAILYKQASLLAFDKIFYIAPNVRLEPLETSSTHRHLAEFHQIDVEMAGASRDAITHVAQGLVTHAVRRVLAAVPDSLAALGRSAGAFGALLDDQAFGRMTHRDAVLSLHDLGHPQSPDAEIDWAGERLLSAQHPGPFFITDYPKGSRGFYDRESRDCPGTLRNFDLIAPEGYGELCSGSEREHDYARIVTRIRETGENPAKYGWYLDLARQGIPASAGFGLGVERFTRYVAGLHSVWQASAYPKLPGVVSP
jgi:aspartyl/asparaginyl-tRNA synthetase/glutamate mutase epsilon subunit